MKISIVSDLHLEFCAAPELPGGDILLMAGDIFGAGILKPNRNDADARSARKRASKFCAEQLSKYSWIYYVLGNHEHYRSFFEETAGILEAFFEGLAPNLILLDNDMAEVDGIRILGTTLWSRCGVGRPGLAEWRIGNAMRDFQDISTREPPPPDHPMPGFKGTRLFQPFDANREHQKALRFLSEAAKTDQPTILLTHHAPSFQSAHGHEYGSEYLDDAYCANLVDFLQQHPNIKLAVHGHTHHPEHYRIGDTLVVSNPRGYFPDQTLSRYFDAAAEDLDSEALK